MARNFLPYPLADNQVDHAWNPDVNGSVNALAMSGGIVYIGGQRTECINDKTRKNIAAVDTVSGALLPWNPGANKAVNAIALMGNTVYTGCY